MAANRVFMAKVVLERVGVTRTLVFAKKEVRGWRGEGLPAPAAQSLIVDDTCKAAVVERPTARRLERNGLVLDLEYDVVKFRHVDV